MSSAALSQDELRARAEQLAARANAPPSTSWIPDGTEGHPVELVGVLVRTDRGFTKTQKERQIAVLRDLDGKEWSVWFHHQVLIDEFARKQPQIGELVLIRFCGQQTPQGGGKPYYKYAVEVDREGASVDWGSPVEGAGSDEAGEQAAAGPGEGAADAAAAVPAAEPEQQPLPQAEVKCDACGFLNGHHKDGCPHDIPF